METTTMEALTIDANIDRLTQRREQLLTTLRHLDDEQKQVEHNTDWVDQAAYVSRIALLDGLRQDFRAELIRIDRALERIANHQYGTCAACHDAIEPKRLESVPDAEYCCSCESFREGLEQYAA
ncbi:MAG: TraR/DksA family transcriptional regulator [Candidatus Binatia bacterium]